MHLGQKLATNDKDSMTFMMLDATFSEVLIFLWQMMGTFIHLLNVNY